MSYYETLPTDNKEWVFRGERSDRFKLASSLERSIFSYDGALTNAVVIERKLIREFKRRLHHYTNVTPPSDDYIEWMALMQHYGAPTRLLDWTYSFFVAIFFAIASPYDGNSVLWALNQKGLYTENVAEKFYQERGERDLSHEKLDYGDGPWKRQSTDIEYFINNPKPFVCSVNPFRLNERQTIQQGVFLFPGDITKGFEENMKVNGYGEEKLTRLVVEIDLETRKEFVYKLHRMNISQATLFPGLEGFAKSLSTRIAFHKIIVDLD